MLRTGARVVEGLMQVRMQKDDVARGTNDREQDHLCVQEVRSVLIVDDEGSARRQLECGFLRLGIETRSVANLRDARTLAFEHKPDLVLVECGPVAAPGLELIESVHRGLPATRVVIVTSYGSVAAAVLAVRRGAAQYLCKPVTAALVLGSLCPASSDPPPPPDATLTSSAAMMTLDQAIWEYLHHTLEMSGSMAEAARRLGLWRQSLRRMLNKYRPPNVG